MATKRGPLMKVHWKRVVADEGHILKNPKAKSECNLRDSDDSCLVPHIVADRPQ